jgi:hypothetical protein
LEWKRGTHRKKREEKAIARRRNNQSGRGKKFVPRKKCNRLRN